MSEELNVNESKVPESTLEELNIPHSTGILGDTTNHDLAMTRLWIKDDRIEKAEVKIVGSSYTSANANLISEQMKGRKISELEFVINYRQDRDLKKDSFRMNIIYESIIRALDNYHNPPPVQPESSDLSDMPQNEAENPGAIPEDTENR